MLDRRFVLENAELVQANCERRGVKVDVARFCELEKDRKKKQSEVEELNRQANLVSKSIGEAKDEAERVERKTQGRRLREQRDAQQAEVDRLCQVELEKLGSDFPYAREFDVVETP